MGLPAIVTDLQSRGFQLEAMGDQLRVIPASRLTDELRATIRAHKAEILAALESRQASNDPPPYDASEAVREAVTEREAIMWEAGVPKWRRTEVIEAAERFYNHLFGPGKTTGCCRASVGIYCDEGQRLREEYYARCQS